MPESENQKNTNYRPFFQSSSSNTPTPAEIEAERERAKQEAIANIENYQATIKDREETKEKIKRLLTKGNLSETAREKAIKTVQLIETEVANDKAEVARWIASSPGLTAHFNRQAP